MRLHGAWVSLVSGAAIVVYGACSTARLGPRDGLDAGGEEDPGTDVEESDAAPRDAAAKDARAPADLDSGGDSGSSAWPCPAPTDAGPAFDREWVTGGLAPAAPGGANYATRTGSVCDRTTLLEWERAVSATLRSWTDAVAYCDSLSLEGASDWRLPTRIELLSIVDYTHKEPAIDAVAFPGTPVDGFWSSTKMFGVFNDPNAYFVYFDYGQAIPFAKSEPLFVRCVRGGR